MSKPEEDKENEQKKPTKNLTTNCIELTKRSVKHQPVDRMRLNVLGLQTDHNI